MNILKQFFVVGFIVSVSFVSADDGAEFLTHFTRSMSDQDVASQVLEHAKLFFEKARAEGWSSDEIDQAIEVSLEIAQRAQRMQGNNQLDLRAELLKNETATLKIIKYFNILASLTGLVTTTALLLMMMH